MSKPTRTTKPLSVRFTDEERAVLRDAAGNLSVSAFVRDSALKAAGERTQRRKTSYDPSETRTQLAQVLALLGKSRASGALREILDLARLGALPVTPELEAKIDAACTDIAEIKTMLMAAIGLKSD